LIPTSIELLILKKYGREVNTKIENYQKFKKEKITQNKPRVV